MIPSESAEENQDEEALDAEFALETDLYNGLKNGDVVTCGGVISQYAVKSTKTGSRFAILTIEDLTGRFDALLFNKAYDKFKDLLAKDILVSIKGKFTVRDGRRPSITVDNLELLNNKDDTDSTDNNEKEEEVEVVKPRKLWLKYNLNDGIIHDAVLKILSAYNGSDEVCIKDTASNKAYKINKFVTIRESLIYELETILNKDDIFIQE